ncbi:hypothetical protein C468_14093 [Halorubrum kocurii JCM 14978]|uniref:Uncharacterized protein n=1 Tax=Halorubrum kocurii JCM 14978 TaxID=1230456 RepID=M0NRT1_9EURY|nr:hypothetical protein C468_14093 [Halorubrum kocurii JCM 14978]
MAYIATVAALIVSETLGRLVSGLFALPRLAVDAVGDVYAALAGEVVGFWPEIFESAFSVQEVAFGELGVLGFLAAGAFVLVWFLVLNELVEVL